MVERRTTCALVPGGHYQIVTGGNALGLDIYHQASAWRAVRHRMGRFILFIALARMVTFCKEGGGILSVWALRTRSYKTKAEV